MLLDVYARAALLLGVSRISVKNSAELYSENPQKWTKYLIKSYKRYIKNQLKKRLICKDSPLLSI